VDIPDTHSTLYCSLQQTISRTPDAPAAIERSGGAVFSTISFAELGAAVGEAAALLDLHGVRRGDVVACWLPNWTEALVLEYALAHLGAANLGVNTRYGVHELTHLLARGRPVGILAPARFHSLDFAGRLSAAIEALADASPALVPPWVATVRGTPEEAPELDAGGGTWAFEPVPGTPPPPLTGHSEDMLNYFTTSGSTGVPKLAGHSQLAVATHARNTAIALEMVPGDVVLGVLPLSGVFGFNPVMGSLAAGGAVMLEPVFDAAATLSGMSEFGVTHAVGGDDLFGRLLDAWKLERPSLSGFRRGGIADFAGRAGEVVEWAERELGAKISGVYGSSEIFALSAIWPANEPLAERVRGGGRPVSEEIEVRVMDPQTNRECEPGEPGELQFRGYNVLSDYLGDAQARESAFTDDGWLRSGDLGASEDARGGFLYICRAGDALRLRGFMVEPAEIEQFLASHPDVAIAKVVGVQNDGADVAVAFVSAQEGHDLDAEELLAFAKASLAPFKVPSRINVVTEFPVTTGTNGTKIRISELRRQATEQLG
jgi:acyl-CoA synthetase (AMP-forming)/AMP-acid ligase II